MSFIVSIFFLCFLNKSVNCSFAIGAVSHKKNFFWSQKMPGIHSCENLGNLTKNFLNFGEVKLYYKGENSNDNLTFCKTEFSPETVKLFKTFSLYEAFISFYYNDRRILVNITYNNDSKNIYLYTYYRIIVKNRSISTETLEPVLIREGESFRINTYFDTDGSLSSKSISWPNFDILNIYIYCLLFLLNSIVFMLSFMSLRGICSNNNIVDATDSLKMHKYFKLELVVCTYGFALLFSLLFYLFLSKSPQPHSLIVISSIVMGTIPASIWESYFYKLSHEPFQGALLSLHPILLLFSFLTPTSAANIIGKLLFGSFRGSHLVVTIPMMLLISFLSFRMSHLVGFLYYNVKSSYTILFVGFRKYNKDTEMKLCSKIDIIFTPLFVFSSYFISRPIQSELFDYFLHGETMNTSIFIDYCIKWLGFSTLLSLIRTYCILRSRKVTCSWMSGYLINSISILLISGLPEVYRLFKDMLFVYHFEACIFYAVGVVAMIGMNVGLYSGLSMFLSFLLVYSAFNTNNYRSDVDNHSMHIGNE